jgi:erythromycin esterase
MAENVQWILEHEPPGTKIVLWGHTTHLAAQQVVFSEMGRRLRERHGSAYFVVGTAFGAGSFVALDRSQGRTAGGLQANTLGPAPAGSLDAALGLVGHPLFAVGLRDAAGPVGAWLDAKLYTRSVGGIFRGEEKSGVWRSPRQSYDAIVYVDKVTPSHVNPGAHASLP